MLKTGLPQKRCDITPRSTAWIFVLAAILEFHGWMLCSPAVAFPPIGAVMSMPSSLYATTHDDCSKIAWLELLIVVRYGDIGRRILRCCNRNFLTN